MEDLHHDFGGLGRADSECRLFPVRVGYLEVAVVVDDRNRVSHNNLSKGFADAASSAAHKGVERQRVAVLTIGFLEPLAAWVEPVGHVTTGFLPLSGVVVHCNNAHVESGVFLDRQAVKHSHITAKRLLGRDVDWGLNAQRLVEALVKILEVHHRVVLKFACDVVFNCLDCRDDLT